MEELKSKDQINDVFAKFIFLSFLFLFVIVMMNLVNAFAIQDIQVCILDSRIFENILCVLNHVFQELQAKAVTIRNKRKIINIIGQNPEVYNIYSFSDILKPPKLHSSYQILRWLVPKVWPLSQSDQTFLCDALWS